MGGEKMKAVFSGTISALLVLALGLVTLNCASQTNSECSRPRPDWSIGQKTFTFTIPLSLLTQAVEFLGLKLPTIAPLVIPDVEITLHTKFHGSASLLCDSCCDGLTMSADLHLFAPDGTWIETIPPQRVGFGTTVRVIDNLVDQSEKDEDKEKCAVRGTFEYAEKNLRVTLVFAGGLISLPLSDTTGEGEAKVLVSYGCRPDMDGPPVIVSWPRDLVVPIGGEVRFSVVAEVPTRKTWLTLEGEPTPRPTLTFEAVSGKEGVTIEITNDHYEDGKFVYGGEGVVRVAPGASVRDGETEEITIRVEDPQGRYDSKSMTLRFVENHPPKAISGGEMISHSQCVAPVRFAATDPDLPENFGYKLYFLWHDFGLWNCSEAINLYSAVLRLGFAPLTPRCSDTRCELDFSCEHLYCPVPQGKYVFPFTVVEYNPWSEQFGFSDQGSWTLTVNNRRPVVTLSPYEVTARPGETIQATICATDPDGDVIETVVSDAGEVVIKDSEKGRVCGTWSWTVPNPREIDGTRRFLYPAPWYLIRFRATDSFGESGVGYLFVRVLTDLPPKVYDAYALVPRGGSGGAWAYVEDLDSPSVSVFVGNVPSGLSVSAKVEDDYVNPGFGGFMVEFQVSANQSLCDGEYSIPFTLVDSEGNSSSATLHVRVFGNRPPQVRGELQGEATVTLYPDRVQVSPVVLRGEVFDPDGDPVFVEAPGILV
jgi:hypothetical protein